jgi:hypothetical protein
MRKIIQDIRETTMKSKVASDNKIIHSLKVLIQIQAM